MAEKSQTNIINNKLFYHNFKPLTKPSNDLLGLFQIFLPTNIFSDLTDKNIKIFRFSKEPLFNIIKSDPGCFEENLSRATVPPATARGCKISYLPNTSLHG